MPSENHLEELLEQLRTIKQSIPKLDSQSLKFPIIDGDGYSGHKDLIYGLRFFKDAVSKEVSVLDQVCHYQLYWRFQCLFIYSIYQHPIRRKKFQQMHHTSSQCGTKSLPHLVP